MRRLRLIALVLLPFSALILTYVGLAHLVLPPRLFRKAVLNPIPTSVKSIRGSGLFMSEASHTYVLGFRISAEDVPRILESDQFREIEYVEYSLGILRYAEHHFQGHSYVRYHSDGTVAGTHEGQSGVGGSFALFTGWRGWFVPRWFQFAKWRAFKAYTVERKDDDHDFYETRLLIYNPGAGQAYFINYQVRGTW